MEGEREGGKRNREERNKCKFLDGLFLPETCILHYERTRGFAQGHVAKSIGKPEILFKVS